jgi:GT2 family glycosyltransferase
MRFSIIVPTRDRVALLAGSLGAIGNLDYRRSEFEVIVVDDAGRRPATLAGLPAPPALEASVLRLDENGGPAAARNLGAGRAQGDYLLFIDDDCSPQPDLLRQLDLALIESPDAVVGGRVEFSPRRSLAATVSQAITDTVYGHFNPDPRNARLLTGPCLAIAAREFRSLRGFDPSYRTYEDHDFCNRCRSRGLRLVYARDAVVVHRSTSGLWRFLKRHHAYGRGAYRFHHAKAVRAGKRLELEPSGFYLNLLIAGWRGSTPLRGTAVAALIALSQMASSLGFLSAWCAAQSSTGRST